MINTQNRSKFYLAVIAILLITNIVILVLFLQKKDPEKQGARPDRKAFITNFLQKEIGFDHQQLLQYDALSDAQQKLVSSQFDSIRNNKNLQFKQLADQDFNDSAIAAIADKSSESQKVMAISMFTHIKKIRQLCTPEQLPKFDSLFIKIFSRRGGGEGRKKQQNNR